VMLTTLLFSSMSRGVMVIPKSKNITIGGVINMLVVTATRRIKGLITI